MSEAVAQRMRRGIPSLLLSPPSWLAVFCSGVALLLFIEHLRVQSFASNLSQFIKQDVSRSMDDILDFSGTLVRSRRVIVTFDQGEFECGIRRNSFAVWLGITPRVVVKTNHETGNVVSVELWNFSSPVASEPLGQAGWTALILTYVVFGVVPLVALGLYRLGENRGSVFVRIPTVGGGLLLLLFCASISFVAVVKLLFTYGAIAFDR